MNHCSGVNSSIPRYPDWQSPRMMYTRIFLAAINISIIIVGSLGNFLTILTLWMYRSLRTGTRIFMLTLAISDFMGLPPMMGFSLHLLLYGHDVRQISRVFCKVYLCFGQMCLNVSWFCLFFIALERVLLVTRPLKADVFLLSHKRGIAITLTCVVMASMIASCINLGYDLNQHCACRFMGPRVLLLIWTVSAYGVYAIICLHLVISGIILLVITSRYETRDALWKSYQNGRIGIVDFHSLMGPIRMTLAAGVLQLFCLLPFFVWRLVIRSAYANQKILLIGCVLEMLFYLVALALAFPIFMTTSPGFRRQVHTVTKRMSHQLKTFTTSPTSKKGAQIQYSDGTRHDKTQSFTGSTVQLLWNVLTPGISGWRKFWEN